MALGSSVVDMFNYVNGFDTNYGQNYSCCQRFWARMTQIDFSVNPDIAFLFCNY